jgi:predicted aspartyl protease
MNSIRIVLGAFAGACVVLAATAASAACQLGLAADLPVVVDRNQGLATAGINGKPVKFLVDTGSAKTLLWRGAAEGLGLHVVDMGGLYFYGVGGREAARITTVRDLKLGSATAHDIRMISLGPAGAVRSPRYVGILGADLLLVDDLELDYANGAVRLMKAKGCTGDDVVYWNKPYSVATLIPYNSPDSHGVRFWVSLNGKPVEALLDTGSTHTVVTSRAADAAGVTPHSEGVEAAGKIVGMGPDAVKVYTATFETLAIGDEKIQNAKLRLGDIFAKDREVETGSHIASALPVDEPGILLGADFIKAHRIYIARSQGKVYFSYNGGPIFEVAPPAPDDKVVKDRAPN